MIGNPQTTGCNPEELDRLINHLRKKDPVLGSNRHHGKLAASGAVPHLLTGGVT